MNDDINSRIISSAPMSSEQQIDRAVRPKSLGEYIGQTSLREQMSLFVEAAKRRSESLDHVLLYGPPGLGKTTMANIISTELQVNLKQTSGPILDKPGDLAALLTNLEENDVLFIDEIHRLSPTVEELLYPAMEDYQIDILIGEGPAARSIKLDLPPFTLVGATTRAGLLTAPLRDRFGIVQRLQFYSVDELSKIIMRAAKLIGIACVEDGAYEIAERSRGTPRIANRLLRRVRDYAEVKASSQIDKLTSQAALDMLQVDKFGFDEMDRRLIRLIYEQFNGGPVGVESMAAALSEDAGTIEEAIEPYLLQQGYIARTPRGRVLTDHTYQIMGLQKASS